MGGHSWPKIPDHRIYKWERIPQLCKVNAELAKYGLKDPWLRNEVWRYHPGWGLNNKTLLKRTFRGLLPGFILALIFWQGKNWYVRANPEFYQWDDPAFPNDHKKNHDQHAAEDVSGEAM